MQHKFKHQNDHYELSDDKDRLDITIIHNYLRSAYWSEGIPKRLVATAIEISLCFGLYTQKRQIGFARVTTDKSSFAYLADVFVLPDFEGRGLGTALVDFVLRHKDLQGLRRFMLCTRDAHWLYKKFGFTQVDRPESMMQISRPGLYLEQTGR